MRYTSRSMRRRGKGDQWEVTLSHKDPLTGEVVRTYHQITAKTEKQAAKARDELILELERKGGAIGTDITVREFMDAFLAYKEKSGTIEPSTVRGYRGENRWIVRYLGDVSLSELSIPAVAKWMSDMASDGYAPKSCAKAFRLFKQALNWAKAQDLITKNPCDFCKPPKRDKTPINALDKAERTRMLKLARAALGTKLGLAVELALTTGMRRGEVCGLRWSDLNDDGTVTVSRALANAKGGYYVKAPKTASSVRTIPLTNQMYTTLCAMRRDTERLALEFGLPKMDCYILGTQEPESRPYNPSRLGKDFATFAKMNGFECTFHDLRHTFATMMIAGGCDVRTVASYLGHASVSMTLDTYADVDPDAKKAAVSKVEDSFDFDSEYFNQAMEWHGLGNIQKTQAPQITFTEEQLLAMLEQVRGNSGRGDGVACA